MRNPKDRLLDMLEAIDNIERYASRGRAAFEQDELIQNWFVHHLQIIVVNFTLTHKIRLHILY